MKVLLEQIFGTYTPVVDGEGIPLIGLAAVDWVWIAGVLLFAIVLYSFFRILGVLFK